MTSAQRYWASMAAIVVATILVAGLLGGTVSLLTGAREGRSSMWGGMVVALIMLAGWTLGTRVRDRKKLDLPLWHRLTEEQAATLKQYHQWSRTGRIEQDDDAKRTSATGETCRCNKAKVLSIKSFDGKTSYKEAMSLVDPKFIYRVGQWMEVKNFNEDRWYDSTTGIHFWLTPEEAKAY